MEEILEAVYPDEVAGLTNLIGSKKRPFFWSE